MPHPRKLGREAEDRACRYLLGLGWTLVGRRWKGGIGEIDILALDGETLVAVEVKYSQSKAIPPESLVTAQKARRIAAAMDAYLAGLEGEERQVRYDVVAIDGDEMRHLRDAFRPE